MPFEPGHPKTGGRQKGTPNKIPSTGRFGERLEELGFDAAKEATLLYEQVTDIALKTKLLDLIVTYGFAKPVALPSSQLPVENPLESNLDEKELLQIAMSNKKNDNE